MQAFCKATVQAAQLLFFSSRLGSAVACCRVRNPPAAPFGSAALLSRLAHHTHPDPLELLVDRLHRQFDHFCVQLLAPVQLQRKKLDQPLSLAHLQCPALYLPLQIAEQFGVAIADCRQLLERNAHALLQKKSKLRTQRGNTLAQFGRQGMQNNLGHRQFEQLIDEDLRYNGPRTAADVA